MNRQHRIASALSLGGAALLLLSGCVSPTSPAKISPKPQDSSSQSPTLGTPATEPLQVQMAQLQGANLRAEVGTTIDVNLGSENLTAWTSKESPAGVVTYIPADQGKSATTNPGYKVVGTGKTTVTLTNSVTNKRITFTVTGE